VVLLSKKAGINIYNILKSLNYTFLKHDSFISCSQFFQYDQNVISKFLGRLSKDDLKKVYRKVKNSNVLPQADIELISTYIDRHIYEISPIYNFKFTLSVFSDIT
jgi:hypothetical protein